MNNEFDTQEVHRPSRGQTLGFFILSLVAAAAILAWTFWLNKGTLNVQGEAPFRVKIAGKETACKSSPCRISLVPRSYKIIIEKEGFFPDDEEVVVKRAQDTELEAAFQIIPTLKENNAILPLLKKETPAQNVSLDQDKNGATLNIIRDKKVQKVASFERPFVHPRMSQSPAGDKVLIADETENGTAYYLVDVEQKTRRRLSLTEKVTGGRWAGPYLIFEEPDGQNGKRTLALETKGLTEILLPAADGENIISTKPDRLIFLSAQKQGSDITRLGPSIQEALDEGSRGLSPAPVAVESKLFLIEYDVTKKIMRTLVEITIKNRQLISKLTASADGKSIYFSMGEKGYEVILENSKSQSPNSK